MKWKLIEPLADLLKSESVVGVVRFAVCSSFSPAQVFTFMYTDEKVTAFKWVGWRAVAAELPLAPVRDLGIVANWQTLRAAALAAPSCMTPMFDGVIYAHSLRDGDTSMDVEWFNPSPREHPDQCALVAGYQHLIALAWPSLTGRRGVLQHGLFAGSEGVIQSVDELRDSAVIAVTFLGKRVELSVSLDELELLDEKP
jgi:hypothetical protein